MKDLEQQIKNGQISKLEMPSYYGGYWIKPHRVEFLLCKPGLEDVEHERVVYELSNAQQNERKNCTNSPVNDEWDFSFLCP